MADEERRLTWLLAPPSRMAHALRERPVKVREPSVRLSWCGRVSWHRTAVVADPGVPHCASCVTAISRVA